MLTLSQKKWACVIEAILTGKDYSKYMVDGKGSESQAEELDNDEQGLEEEDLEEFESDDEASEDEQMENDNDDEPTDDFAQFGDDDDEFEQ
jgi:hypothetical protein